MHVLKTTFQSLQFFDFEFRIDLFILSGLARILKAESRYYVVMCEDVSKQSKFVTLPIWAYLTLINQEQLFRKKNNNTEVCFRFRNSFIADLSSQDYTNV